MSKIIMITSGKGGVGKTTVCAALGAVLSEIPQKVLLVDGDLGLRDLDLALGVQDEVFYTSSDVWNKECLPIDAIININENLDFLPASQTQRWEDVKRKKLGKIIKKQRKNYDFIIIDSPAGIGRGMESLINNVDEFCIIVEGNWMALRDAQRVIQFLKEHGIKKYHIVLNKVEHDTEETLLEPYEIAEIVGVDYLSAVIPFNKKIIAAGHNGEIINLFNDEVNERIIKPLVDSLINDKFYEIESILHLIDSIKCNDKHVKIESDNLKNNTLCNSEENIEEKNLREIEIKIKKEAKKIKENNAPSIARRKSNRMWKWGRRGRC